MNVAQLENVKAKRMGESGEWSESGAQWWRWAGCSHSPVLSWGLVRGWGLKRVRGGGRIGGVNLRFRQAFGWQMAVKQVGVQRRGFWLVGAGRRGF